MLTIANPFVASGEDPRHLSLRGDLNDPTSRTREISRLKPGSMRWDGGWEIESVNIGRRDPAEFLRGLKEIKLIGGAFLRSIETRKSNGRRGGIISRPTAFREIYRSLTIHVETTRGTRLYAHLRKNSSHLRDYHPEPRIFYHTIYIFLYRFRNEQ